MSMAATTIKVSPETKELLRSLGEKGESFDEIINKIVSSYLAHVEELYERANEYPIKGRPLKEIVDELEGRGPPGSGTGPKKNP